MKTTVMSNEPGRCPVCGSVLAASAPQGLCPQCLLAAATAPTEPEPGGGGAQEVPSIEAVRAAFPHLEVLELIGAGGMGAVFRARQPRLDRVVALKLLAGALSRKPAFAERFNREARVLARLNHPNIVTVYDFGEAGGFFYLLMEHVDGVNLRQAMRAGRFTPVQALEVVPKVCEALQFAHEHGVLHRDIKPENILLDRRGRVKIADFGIAKLVGQAGPEVTLTASGASLGTPAYMAPEQIERPGDVDHRADIYSLGVVFYEMLTGELPLGRFAPPSAKTPLDERVDEIVLRALAKERELRQQSAGEVKTQVEEVAAAPAQPGPVARPLPAVGPAAPDFILCHPRLPRMAQAITVYGLLGAPFLWALGLTLSLDFNDLAEHPGAAVLLGIWQFVGETLGGLATTLVLLVGALRLRGLDARGPAWLRTGVWLRIGLAVLGLLVFIWAAILDWEAEVTDSRIGYADAIVMGVLLLATGWEIAMLVWLRRHRAAIEAVLREARPGNDGSHGNVPPVTAPPSRTSWKAVVSAVLSVPFWIQAAGLTVAGVVGLFGNAPAPSWLVAGGGVAWAGSSVGPYLGLLGMVLGYLALGDIRRGGGRLGGLGLAIMGLLGVPYGLVLVWLPGGMLGLGATGGLAAALGRRLFEVAPIWLAGLLVLGIVQLRRWYDPARAGEDRRRSLRRAGAVGGVIGILALLALPSATLRHRGGVGGHRPAGAADSLSPREDHSLAAGFRDRFTIPAGQAAAFEMVTRQRESVVSLPRAVATAFAPATRSLEVVLACERDPAADIPGLRRAWQLSLSDGKGWTTSAGVDIPSAFASALGAASLGVKRELEPEGEYVRWFHEASGRPPAVGLRVITRPHGRDDEEVNSGRCFEIGTNRIARVTSVAGAGRDVEIRLNAPPRETLVLTGLVFSNGVPLEAGELRARLWPPRTRAPSPYGVRWAALASPGATNGPSWEIVVEDDTSRTLAARLRPAGLPRLDWAVAPAAAQGMEIEVGREARTIEVARALQASGGGNEGVADWSLRLRVQSSPAAGTARRGAVVDFVLPAEQAVTFELVRRTNGTLVAVPGLAAFLVNGRAEPYTGRFILADDPDRLDDLTGEPVWSFGITGEGQRLLTTGRPPTVPVPADLTGSRSWSLDLWKDLAADAETVEGLVGADAKEPAYGLRIRTARVGRPAGQQAQIAGYGTNWTQQVAGVGAGTPAGVFGSVQIGFGVRSGQGAIIEMVTDTRAGVQTIPGAAGYLLASPDRDASVVLLWGAMPGATAEGGRVPWRMEFRGEAGARLAGATNLVLPEAVAAQVPGAGSRWSGGWLDPDAERVHWLVERSGGDRPGVGFRLRTFGHGLGRVELKESGFAGMGTNWVAEFPPEIRTPPPVYRHTELLPQPAGAGGHQSALFRIPAGLEAMFEVWEAGGASGAAARSDKLEVVTPADAERTIRVEWRGGSAAGETWEVVVKEEATGGELKRFAGVSTTPRGGGWMAVPVEAGRVREENGHEMILLERTPGASPTDGGSGGYVVKLYYGAGPVPAR